MPAIHHQTFRANFYECDAYGYLHNVMYANWMQEAAFGASSAVGYDFSRYNALKHLWLVRETQLEIYHPIRYGDSVALKTYVTDFRRFRSRRVYQFTNLRTGQLAAQANTDWVYVNAENLRPAKIPEEMQWAFFPEGPPSEESLRERFPAVTAPFGRSFSTTRTVRWHEIDQMWHVNNTRYLLYLEEAHHRVNTSFGWPMARMQQRGFRIVSERQHVEYRLPALLGDELEVATWVTDYCESGATRYSQIIRVADRALLVQARVNLRWVNLETGDPISIPTDYLRDLEPNLATV